MNKSNYTDAHLSPASVAYAVTPELVRRGLARHDVPAFRLARLAVDRKVLQQGLGGQLSLAAGRRCLLASVEVGGVALLTNIQTEDRITGPLVLLQGLAIYSCRSARGEGD